MGHQLVRNLKALLSYAADEIEAIAVNPLLRMKLPKLEPRERTLIAFHPERKPEPAELMAIWRAADQCAEPQRAWIKVLILTGQRENEVAGMRWEEVDGALWRIPKARHKGKRGHDLTLPPAAMALIEALAKGRHAGSQTAPSDYVFAGRGGRPIGDFSGIKERVTKLSGISGWRWHDVRRSCGSWIEEEFGLEVQKAVLGHALGDKLARTYSQGSGCKRKKQALAAWADYITGADSITGSGRGKILEFRA